MRLTRLALSNFRNYEALELDPAPGLNLFVGANAQGKSNLLEAVAMLGTGKSFRTNKDGDTVREGTEMAELGGDAEVRAGVVRLACGIAKGGRGTRKTYTVNGRNVRYSGYLGKLRVVTFVPADLQLAGGAPGLRRSFLNVALAQEEPLYYRELARYRTALQQKNALLRAAANGTPPDPELMAVYESEMVDSGTHIVLVRDAFVRAIAEAAREAHARIAGGRERLDVAYDPDVRFESADAESIRSAFEARLAHVAESERARKSSAAGPHRDDVTLQLDGTSLAAYGSQGQQRTAVLALKIAEYSVMRDRASEAPLLLLDDVLSELDESRATAFLAGVGDFEQAFVTATHVPEALPRGAHRFAVASARIVEEAVAC